MVIAMPELAGVKPLRPMLHKFDYVPIEQPVLADGVVRFVGEPVAAVVASSEEEAEDIVDLVEVEIEEIAPVVDANAALAHGAQAVHGMAPSNVIVEGKVETGGFDATWAAAAHIVGVEVSSRRQNAMPLEPRGGHATYDLATGRVTLTCSTQMPHMLRTGIADLRSACRKPICASSRRMSAAASGRRCRCFPNTSCWSGWRANFGTLGRLDRGPAREPDRLVSQPRPDATRCGARSTPTASCSLSTPISAAMSAPIPATRPPARVEPLMAMAELPGPYDVREYAVRCARRRDQYLPDGALSRRVAAGDHSCARTPDG